MVSAGADSSTGAEYTKLEAFGSGAYAGQRLALRFAAKTAGTFPCRSQSITSVVLYDPAAYPPAFLAGDYIGFGTTEQKLVGQCSIAVTAYGDVGAPIEGTFTATLQRDPPDSSSVQQHVVSGSFRLIREADKHVKN